jgi:excisionase family DNA binding protein
MNFLSTKEVAQMLQVTKMTVTRMAKSGKLTPINSQKDYFLFDAEQVESLTFKKQQNDK